MGTRIGFTVLAWVVALILFSPILWVLVTAFKSEAEAIAYPPTFLPQTFTLDNFFDVQDRSDYVKHAINSIIVSFGSTLVGAHRSRSPRPGPWRSRRRPRRTTC
jgi:sorbitol/mannitol transport system permease protein